MARLAVKFHSGMPETWCGNGSLMENTVAVRAWLPELVKDLGIKTLLDAACGDCNWIATVDLGCKYIGIDDDPCNLKASHGLDVRLCDIVTGTLPDADLLLCRDCLQHFTNEMISGFLANFVDSGIEWLLATSYRSDANWDIGRYGAFHPVNLCKPPFNLPEPSLKIDDGGKDLALWHRIDIRC